MSFRGNSEVKLKKQAWDYARIKHSEFSNAYAAVIRGDLLFNLIAPIYGLFYNKQRKHYADVQQ